MTDHWCVTHPAHDRRQQIERRTKDEQEARSFARDASVRHGHAIVTNGAGQVATYVDGQLWEGSGPTGEPVPGEVNQG